MGDVAILSPQHCLRHHHHRSSNPKPARRTRHSPPPRPAKAHLQARTVSPPVVGPVRILRRGEDIPVPNPRPEIQPKREEVMRVDGFYAGSGFVTSPPPSSVPLPAFFTAGRRNCGGVAATTEADIATGLRRLLKLQ